MPERPNIKLIWVDEMRADALSCFGNEVCRTPNIDALAASGTTFTQCMVTQPTCSIDTSNARTQQPVPLAWKWVPSRA